MKFRKIFYFYLLDQSLML